MHKSRAFFGAARDGHGRDLETKTALPDLIFIMVFGKEEKSLQFAFSHNAEKPFA